MCPIARYICPSAAVAGDEPGRRRISLQSPPWKSAQSPNGTERLLRRLRCERGVGLVELLAVVPMLAATLMATYALYNVASKSQQRTENRVRGLVQQQIGFERMSREMRQATSVTPVSSQIIDVTTWVRPNAGPLGEAPRPLRVLDHLPALGGTRRRRAHQRARCRSSATSRTRTSSRWCRTPWIRHTSLFRVEVKVTGRNKPIVFDGGFALRNPDRTRNEKDEQTCPAPDRHERGFTLIEILIAMALVAVGVAATIGVFGTSSRATVRAQRARSACSRRRPRSTASRRSSTARSR